MGIINGNYEFLDFEAHREEIYDAFIEFYGKENEAKIRERLDKCVYVPYYSYDLIVDYYNQYIGKFVDEIYEEFCKLTGLESLTDKQKELVWQQSGSSLLASVQQGTNLDFCTFKGENYVKAINDARKEVADNFDLQDKENPLPEIQRLTKHLNTALSIVSRNHECDVTRDLNHHIHNRTIATQMFLNHVTKWYAPITEKDREYINSGKDFDSVDIEDLDCKYALFGDNIGKPGLISYFTKESEEKLRLGGTPEEITEILAGRCKFVALNVGAEELKFVKEDELYGSIDTSNDSTYLERLQMELDYWYSSHIELFTDPATASNIENMRKLYSANLFAGCKFAGNLNADVPGNTTYDSESEDKWVTMLDYEDHDPNKPVDVIYFNEHDEQDSEQLLRNLIHEVDHVASHGIASICSKGGRAYARFGVSGNFRELEDDGSMGEYIDTNLDEAIKMTEENLNERFSKYIYNIYRKKYANPYTPCDITCSWREATWCYYDYWDFVTERFFKRYGKVVRDYRINQEEEKLFFDLNNDIPATSQLEGFTNDTKAKLLRYFSPYDFEKTGKIRFEHFAHLGDIIIRFKDTVLPEITSKEMSLDEFKDPNHEKWAEISDETKVRFEALKQEVDEVMDMMLDDDKMLCYAKKRHDDPRAIRNRLGRLVDGGKDVVEKTGKSIRSLAKKTDDFLFGGAYSEMVEDFRNWKQKKSKKPKQIADFEPENAPDSDENSMEN